MASFPSSTNVLRLFLLTLILLTGSVSGEAQLKSKRLKLSPSSLIKESDLDYQLWEGFQLVQQANAGDLRAQHELGLRYIAGRGFFADTSKAFEWIKKASDRGLSLAQYNLSLFYMNGWGTEWDPFLAYRLQRHASDQGMPEAQFIVALMLTENLVVTRNLSEAYRLMKMAADADLEPAQEALAEFQKKGYDRIAPDTSAQKRRDTTGSAARQKDPREFIFLNFGSDSAGTEPDDFIQQTESILRDIASLKRILNVTRSGESWEMIRRASMFGSPEARVLLGRCFELGATCPKDPLQAAAHYLSALRLDYPRAYELLRDLVYQREFAALLEKRAKAEDPVAQYVWAGLLALRIDFRLTEQQSLGLLTQSASKDFSDALLELGVNAASGRWMPQDRQKAMAYWTRAAERGSKEAEIRLAVNRILGKESDQLEEDLQFLHAAVNEGSILAHLTIAYCHEKGIGLPQNRPLAVRIYRSIARRGSEGAYVALQRMHDEIRPDDAEFRIGE